MQDLKAKTIQGGLARVGAQAVTFLLRVVSLVVLARLLSPTDFGLVGMVTAFTGVLTLFRDFGLSSATVQRQTVTEEQMSTLFWINMLVGAILWLVAVIMAPAIAAFYGKPELFSVTIVLAAAFPFNAAGVQHSALLQRQMRFTTLATINVVSLAVGTAIAIAGAAAGYGYWGLVAMSVSWPLTASIGFWAATGWAPKLPRRGSDVASIVRYGGGLTFTSVFVYVGYNAEKVLIGRFWGADAIGIYGRGYQLVSIPTDNLNAAIGEVAFAALSRVQHDPDRLRSYFLKGLSLILGLTLPITAALGFFADDVVLVLLGPNWQQAAPIVRLLAPTVAILAIINPLGWLIFSIGMVGRGVRAAPVLATVMITSYIIGLPYGPQGVALAYSVAMTLWVIPHILWCVHGTPVSFYDVLSTALRPLASSILAGGLAFVARCACGQSVPIWSRMVIENGVLFLTFYAILLFAVGQKSLYLDILRGLRGGGHLSGAASSERLA
jgi:O-antigen/teichoic acid export membrane protein